MTTPLAEFWEPVWVAVVSTLIVGLVVVIVKALAQRKKRADQRHAGREQRVKRRALKALDDAAALAEHRAAEDREKEEAKKQRPRFEELQREVRRLVALGDVKAWVHMFEYRKALDEYIGDDDGKAVTYFADCRNCFLSGTTASAFDPMRLSHAFGKRHFNQADIEAARGIGKRADAYLAEYHDTGTAYQAKRQLTMDLLRFVGDVATDLNDLMG